MSLCEAVSCVSASYTHTGHASADCRLAAQRMSMDIDDQHAVSNNPPKDVTNMQGPQSQKRWSQLSNTIS